MYSIMYSWYQSQFSIFIHSYLHLSTLHSIFVENVIEHNVNFKEQNLIGTNDKFILVMLGT